MNPLLNNTSSSLLTPTSNRAYFFLSALLLALLIVFLPRGGYTGDLNYWATWATHIYTFGLPQAYTSLTDYLPGQQYLIYIFNLFQSDETAIAGHIHYIKVFSLLFHFGTGFLLFDLIRQYREGKAALWWSMLYVLNPMVLYNGYIWGQSDDVFTFFVFLSCRLALKRSFPGSMLALLLAINFKIQAAIFLPPVLLIVFPSLKQHNAIRQSLTVIVLLIVTQLVILFPFMLGGTLSMIGDVITNSFNRYPNVSINAYNLWYLIMPGDPHDVLDSAPCLGALNYKQTGLLLFFLASFFALWPAIKNILRQVRQQSIQTISTEKTLIIFGLIPLLFFYFNTEMHERYSHPALIFLIGYGILSGRFLPALFSCIAYVLNLEAVLKWLELSNYSTFIFDPHFSAALFGISIVLLFADLYRNPLKKPMFEDPERVNR